MCRSTAQSETADAPSEITGYLRFPEATGWFVAAHDAKGEIWFVRDPQAMAEMRGWGPVAPFYVDQEAPVPGGRASEARQARRSSCATTISAMP